MNTLNKHNLKKFIFSFLVIFILLQLTLVQTESSKNKKNSNKEKEKESGGFGFEFTIGNYSSSNYSESQCFRILQTSPWSTIAEIKRKYEILSEKYENNKEKKDEVEKAYKTMENRIKEGTFKESSFYQILFKGFQDMLIFDGIFGLIYLISKLVYMFQQYFNQFIFYQVISFLIISRFFPHYFDNSLVQYIVSLSLGCVLFFRRKIFCLILGKKDEQNETHKKIFYSCCGACNDIKQLRCKKGNREIR